MMEGRKKLYMHTKVKPCMPKVTYTAQDFKRHNSCIHAAIIIILCCHNVANNYCRIPDK